jgi:hypothetical protein
MYNISFLRIKLLLFISWMVAFLLSLINMGQLKGIIPWLRRTVSATWQLLFWSGGQEIEFQEIETGGQNFLYFRRLKVLQNCLGD